MAPPEHLLAHRDLQYLRAAAAANPRRRLSTRERQRRRRYARERWEKYRALTRTKGRCGRN